MFFCRIINYKIHDYEKVTIFNNGIIFSFNKCTEHFYW